ncbi:DUF2165 family protein [Phyllobacterium sp. TAF24]|uniref:DUF2165 family protein n=1 Tax=Phyllobacterium sp. TAF24 TaxID=3233068 RepID=UPI003F9E5A2E
MNPTLFSKSVLLVGIACWMTVAAINNVTDPATNRFFLETMLEMRLLSDDPNQLGIGLIWRAWSVVGVASALLWIIVAIQFLIATYLWKGAGAFLLAAIRKSDSSVETARATSIRALTCFLALWLTFMVGGFWFGYWIKQGAIQQVHMTLLILSIVAISYVANRSVE